MIHTYTMKTTANIWKDDEDANLVFRHLESDGFELFAILPVSNGLLKTFWTSTPLMSPVQITESANALQKIGTP